MCGCLNDLENELKQAGFEGADIQGTAFICEDGTMKLRTVQDCIYKDGTTKSGKDRIKHIPIKHTYCPFCGNKYK